MRSISKRLFEQLNSFSAIDTKNVEQEKLFTELEQLRQKYPEYQLKCTKNTAFKGDAYNVGLYKKDGEYLGALKGPVTLKHAVEFFKNTLSKRTMSESVTKKRITFEVSGDAINTLEEFLNALSSMGKMGCSRSFVINDFPNDGKTTFYFDGDGADKLNIVSIEEVK